MATRFYQIADGLPWQPSGVIADKDGVRRSAANVLSIWPDADIVAAFPVLPPTWGQPPAGQMVDTETVAPDGTGGLVFTRTFKAQPDPTPAEIGAALVALVKSAAKDRLYGDLATVTRGQYTRAQLQTRISNLSAANKTVVANLYPPLAGADLP